MSKPFSTRIGELFAHIQDLFDTIIHASLKRVQTSKKRNNKIGKMISFISTLGDAYFKKYKDIKSNDSNIYFDNINYFKPINRGILICLKCNYIGK